jgi:hypothetical protein
MTRPLSRLASVWLVGVVLAGALALSGCGVGCGRTGGPLPIRKVLIDVEPAAAGVDREQVRAVVDEVLKRARGIRLVDAGRGDDAAVMRVRVEGYGSEEAGRLLKTTLALTVELTSVPGETSAAGFRGHAVASGTGDIDARSLVGQAVRDALAQVLMTRGASDLSSDQLIAWLTDESASIEQRRRAIRILGSRREREAVPPLSRALLEGDKELQPLALSALTNIGDPSAVDAVIEYSDRQPPVVKKQCIEAVRSMGSAKGRAWLFTLSTGHPELEIQQQAAAALAALEAEEQPGAAVAENADLRERTEAVR